MRKGFEGLYGLVRDRLLSEPLSGHIFLFSNAQRNRLKLLFYDGSGLWVCATRLDKVRFRWPAVASEQVKVVLSAEELVLLLGGRYRSFPSRTQTMVPQDYGGREDIHIKRSRISRE